LVIIEQFIPVFVQASDFSELTGQAGIEGFYYYDDASFVNQESGNVSIALQGEYRYKWDDERNLFTFSPFYRYDQKDENRTHGDIRQLDLIMENGNWEYQAGISKVFWGVAESLHLVDIINQTDIVESIRAEDKLGQPMLKVSHILDQGSISFFVLPYFRERTFPGESGRSRTAFTVDKNNVSYESSKEQNQTDYALRFQHTFDEIDLGLSYFDGTSRVPDLIPDFNSGLLKQYYPLIRQTAIDVQYTGEEWLLKLEAINRNSKLEDYAAAVGGFEYTIPRLYDTRIELGLLAEYLYDSRGNSIEVPFQNDLFVGARVVLNDMDNTEILIGGYIDLDNVTQYYSVEASSRIANDFKLNVEIQAFNNVALNDPFYDIKNDGFIRIELQKFF
jgi:hypothetical protein